MLQREVRNGAIHLKWAQDSRSLLDAKPTDGILELRSHAVKLRGFSVVFGDEATELSSALDYAPAL